MHELLDGIAGQATVLSGRCVAYGGTTYRPLVEILRTPGGPEAVTRALAGEDNEQLLAERLEAAGGLSSATFTTDEIFWAVRRFVELNARERPVVLVVDDAHWAEPTFHDLVDYLAAFVTQEPVSLIRLGRPELLDQRPAPPGTETIELGRLVETDAEKLLAGVGAPKLARAEIMAVAEGNPLFLEQLAAVAADAAPGALPIPPTIEAVIAARLDQLPRRELALLECASVIGRRFDMRALVELVRPEDSLHAISSLVALTRAGLVRPRRGLPARIGTGLRTASSATPRTLGSRRRSGRTSTRRSHAGSSPTHADAGRRRSCRPPPRAGQQRVAGTGPRRRARAWARRGGRGSARDRRPPGRRARRRSCSDRPVSNVPPRSSPTTARAAARCTGDSVAASGRSARTNGAWTRSTSRSRMRRTWAT